ncbi:hypothetical protein AMC83_PE00669 (plasmid) [Rhizobium phaseoli]|uniref:DUF5086 family protein n=1 Tax=Rhizobium phaseoli TaxID=396 RepID=UPI0007EA42BC|nr:DUF5086 family protein [Rhizobium phaseoli]ANL76081.1 hypothetical protein AMC83_PE00669 [Rhizobium phaseoli]PDS73914.1 DUF5086 domain-containing protein [Rhizobium phaseoli]
MHAKRKSLTTLFVIAAILCQTTWARAEAVERPIISVIILSVSPRTVRWATVYKLPDPGEDDPYYHVEVIEKERRTPPWQFKRLATHVVVTADALNRSRSRPKARTYFYKDIEFRIAYQNWRAQLRPQREAGVCRTTILECVGIAGRRD